MKKVCVCVILALCLLLSACAEPTVKPVVNEELNGVKEPLRMIKVDGKLYYDSGEVSQITARCGTLDGGLKQVGEAHEIPKNDGECNFPGADGYQRVTSITREVPIDGEWVVFKLFEDPDLDMSVFDYCYYISGRLPNAAKDSQLVVLTEDPDYTFDTHYRQLFSSVYTPGDKVKRTTFRYYGDSDEWGLSLRVRDVTKTGATLVFEQFGGNPTGDLQTGAWFSLEKNINDEWVALTPKAEDVLWNMVAMQIHKNEITEQPFTWEFLYGELESGYYRISKEVMDFREAGDFDKNLYTAYFTIE